MSLKSINANRIAKRIIRQMKHRYPQRLPLSEQQQRESTAVTILAALMLVVAIMMFIRSL